MRLQPQLKNLHARLLERLEQGEPAALATIIQTTGSTPQIPGSCALITPEGLLLGTLGGGVLEKAAERRGVKALNDGQALIFRFDLVDDLSSPEGAVCGGSVRILIDGDPARHRFAFQKLVKAQGRRDSGILLTQGVGEGNRRVSLERNWVAAETLDSSLPHVLTVHRDFLKTCLDSRKPGLKPDDLDPADLDPNKRFLFCEPVYPRPRLLIAGAGHIGRAVAHQGSLLEFEVTVVDDRPEFANPENLPDADHIFQEDIGPALKKMDIDPDTYVVVVTRGHRQDGDALRSCIDSPAAYLGMIGSRSKIALMKKNFLEKGWATPEQWERVTTPIGLDIGSQTVEEIGVSIAAQLVKVYRENLGKGGR